MRKNTPAYRKWFGLLLLMIAFAVAACTQTPPPSTAEPTSMVNFGHLDYLGEEVVLDGDTLRIIHIYADAPSYKWTGDDDEGVACVDDAARATIAYLRDFELSGNTDSARKAKQLLRFIMYMQSTDGLFYNFVWNSELNINLDHQNSLADEFGWWAARATWALGRGAEVLRKTDPDFSLQLAASMERTLPHLEAFLDHYGSFQEIDSRQFPLWLVNGSKSNATSEMLMGLIAFNRYREQPVLKKMIRQFAEGIELMQFGSLNRYPWLAHAATEDHWNGWGNSQTQALSDAGFLTSAEREASGFYPRLLIDGWKYSFSISDSTEITDYPQIAYAVRVVTLGLLGLYHRTHDLKYATMAGLAASWFTGNNVANTVMYDSNTGRGFDGINSSSTVNKNSGAESTIEALMTIQEVEQVPEARSWIFSTASQPTHTTVDGARYFYRIFTTEGKTDSQRIAVFLDLSLEQFKLLEQDSLTSILNSRSQIN